MSTPDLRGWVEVREGSGQRWQCIVDLEPLFPECPDSRVYESLFWPHADGLGFKTAAPGRGVPIDTSELVRADHSGEWFSELVLVSWISWREIQDLDWEEISTYPESDEQPHVYWRDADGQLHYEGAAPGGYPQWWHPDDPETFEADGKVLRYEHISRRRAFERSWGWPTLLKMLSTLGERYGADNVRVVVYFLIDYELTDW